MNNNIFLKNKITHDKKYNPDVIRTFSQAQNIRKTTNYNFTKKFYKTITNQQPEKVNSQKDLKLTDTSHNNLEIKSRLNQTLKSRGHQDNLIKQKYDKKNYTKNINNFNRINRQKKVLEHPQKNFTEIKGEKNHFFEDMKLELKKDKERYLNIIQNLKTNGLYN